MSNAGYVYVLSNPSMPGVVKIGRSGKGGFARARDIYSGATGIPQPFKLEFELFTDDANTLEENVHDDIHGCRVSDSREFFRCDVVTAINAVMDAYLNDFDFRVVNIDEESAVINAHYLASRIDEDYQTVCHAIAYVSDEAIKEAVSIQKERAKKVADMLARRRSGEASCQTE